MQKRVAKMTGFFFLLVAFGAVADDQMLIDPVQMLSAGKFYGDFRLRYEGADQDNALKDASALTLRSRLGYRTGEMHQFSATFEVEDVRTVAGVDDYTVGPTGFNPGVYSVIADPETTEVDQGFIEYKTSTSSTKLGRQVLVLDNHRFVGHVGWRQDRQTYDALSTKHQINQNLSVQYAYIGQRNRIFAEEANKDSKDHLINGSFKTQVGTLVGYLYFLEDDNDTKNSIDTYGLRFTGAKVFDTTEIMYGAEYAVQTAETEMTSYDTDYLLLEGGIKFKGILAKLSAEVLGSDDGAHGFATPLATLHKFNGWADQFLVTPAQGLVDVSLQLSGPLMGGKWNVVYHEFEADQDSTVVDDLGNEINVSYVRQMGKNYSAGIKYAGYSAGDVKVDMNKVWVWVGLKF